MNLHSARWLAVMGPAFLINEEMGFACSMVWVIACLMVIVSTSRNAWRRQ